MVLLGAKSWAQKRAHLLKLGLSRSLVDEMEILSEDVGKSSEHHSTRIHIIVSAAR